VRFSRLPLSDETQFQRGELIQIAIASHELILEHIFNSWTSLLPDGIELAIYKFILPSQNSGFFQFQKYFLLCAYYINIGT
jgi:hypothetical protein